MSMKTPLQVLIGRTWQSTAATARTLYRASCPHFTDRDVLAVGAEQDAVALATIVRDEDPQVVFGALAQYDHKQLSVLCVALAAMVPTDRSAADLLGWLDPIATTEVA